MIENIRLAFQGIWSHKMRSFLTMLGIIIGIASIIAIVSTIQGTSEQIKEDLIGSGSNTVNIDLYEGDSEYDSEYGSSKAAPLLTDDQKQAVRDLDCVVNATFYHSRSNSSIYYQNGSFDGGKIYGIDEYYLDTCGYVLQAGRGFVEEDYNTYRKVAIVDSNAAETLFPSENPIGKTLEISREPFVVVGVVKQKDNYLPNIESLSEFEEYYQTMVGSVLIPNSCWPIVFKFDEAENAVIKADTTDNMSKAGKEAATVMNSQIDNTVMNTKFEYKADDVMERVRNLQKLSESTNQQLIWIASISLLVGGIGVMNIMLVSVTERTREIGIRKALGAKTRSIMMQFLAESAIITLLGGLIGIMLGALGAIGICAIIGFQAIVAPSTVIMATLFSSAVGIFFG
ncbi:MAG: ABC transporter permease, partial [Blautia sp.]|nr:ABC transporter permease [Blautia sp.]